MRNNRKSLLHDSVVATMAVVAALVCASAHVCAYAGEEGATAVTAVQTVPLTRGTISRPVHAYGVLGASASNVTTVSLPYVARVVQMRVQAGQSVARGTPLFSVQADPAAVVAAAQTKSAAQLADDELARTQSLFNESLATQSQLAAARKAALDAREALQAQAQLGVGNGRATIVAPHDGVVTQVSVAQGDQVQAGAAILQISAGPRGSDARPNVTIGVEPSDIASVHRGDRVTIDGLSSALQNTRVEGRVVMVGAAIDAQTQLVDVGANVPLVPAGFMPGTRVKADIATQSGVHWIVPRSAVLSDSRGYYVYQIGPGNKARRIDVAIAVEDGERYGVDGPLDAARQLVVAGNYELSDGAPVRVAGNNQQQGNAR